ncbi:MAG TPA: 8-oxoguanine deaminase [Vicinamibacteria bacterium]|nr:8-oxoguanine deaminase [Vicinamibacteria bacterium]
MSTLLVRNADVLVTMDASRRELRGAGLYAVDGFIRQVGATRELPATADVVLDLTGQIVLPGLVNTHHHLNQTLTRAFPAAQEAGLFAWLTAQYPAWTHIDAEASRTSTLVGLAELLLSGCTTVFDHTYLYQNGNSVDVQVEAAREIGVRFHASRGSMSVGRSKGGLPPDEAVEDEAFILKDSERVIDRFHDPRPGALTRIVLAPCAPFSVSADLLRESAALARARGVRLHTHLAETRDEERYTLERFGVRPVEWMDRLGWVAGDVWFAHAVHVSDAEIERFARAGCGVAHCPSSNMRLASGIAPVKKYMTAGVAVGLAVDGSASNDASNMLLEARQAMLLARLELGLRQESEVRPEDWMSARQALELATLGGARVLGRDDLGSLETGKCADFFSLDLGAVDYAGALHDPVAATVFCAPTRARVTVVHGRVVVEEGQVATVDMGPVVERHNRLAAALVRG